MSAPSIQINVQPMPYYEHQETPHYEEDMSTWVDRETKDKIKELEFKQIEGTKSFRSVNFNQVLCIYPGLKIPTKFKCSDVEKYNGEVTRLPTLSCTESP